MEWVRENLFNMSRILFFIFIALLITNLNTGCSDRYKFQFERGSNFDRRLLAHTERIFPQLNGVVLWVSNPHVSDPFIQKAANEIGISTISGQYCYTNLLRFTNSSQLMQLILQIIAYNSNP